jgi:hypothetical protein
MAMSSCSKEKVTPDMTPTLAVSLETISAATAAGSYTINITANVTWMATSNQTWCSITPASGNGNGTITINVAENTALETRTATVTVKAGALTKTVVVTQLGVAHVLSVNVTEINVTAAAADSTIEITSNLAWTATSSKTWCSISPASGNGNSTLTVNVVENTVIEARTATVTVKAGDLTKTITITQLGVTPILSVDKTEIKTTAKAANSTIEITSNLAWTATSNEPWCSVTPASGNGNGTLTITVAENIIFETRTATVTIKAGELTNTVVVTQSGANVVLSVNTTEIEATIAAAEYTIEITSNSTWTVTSSESWCSVTPVSGEGNGTLTVNIAENTTTEARKATITITSTIATHKVREVTVSQHTTSVVEFTHANGTITFVVTAKKNHC